MSQAESRRSASEAAQDFAHGIGHDYTVGSPHLRHAALRNRIGSRINGVIAEILQRQGECSVLEIGAGHGSFTDTVLAAGAQVTVTEMSKASFDHLAERFRDISQVRVVYDIDGNAPFEEQARYDVILLISVIHHIPDYIGVITRLCETALRPGATVVTFQDPLWYPRQHRWARVTSDGAYVAWRLARGGRLRGAAARLRRLRRGYSDSEPSDLVEYHVVRDGVDDIALDELFRARFASVEVDRYFSTQSPQLQPIGERYFPHNTFGVVARGYIP